MSKYPPLRLHIPEPSGRPGCATDFSYLHISPAGATRRPDVDVLPVDTQDLAYQLVRVLNEDGSAKGPWDPQLAPDFMRRGLKAMMKVAGFGHVDVHNLTAGVVALHVGIRC